MRVRITIPKEHVDEDTLNAALNASAMVAQKQVLSGRIPDLRRAIAKGKVKWKPEPERQGFEGFDNPDDVLDRGWGDCDDLASWWAGQLWATDEDPDAAPVVYQSKKNRWHAVVERGDGTIDDPSRWAGMGKPGGPLPVTRPVTTNGASTVGFRKLGDSVRVRWDVPLYENRRREVVGVTLDHYARDPWAALLGSSAKALAVLGFWGAPDDVMVRLHAISHLLTGLSEGDFAELTGCGYDQCGEFVKALSHRVGATTTTAPDTRAIADIAATIFDPLGLRNMIAPMASQMMQAYTRQPQVVVTPPPPPQVVVTPPVATVTAPSATVTGGDVRFFPPLSDGAFLGLFDTLRERGTCEQVTPHKIRCSFGDSSFVIVSDFDMLRAQKLSGAWKNLDDVVNLQHVSGALSFDFTAPNNDPRIQQDWLEGDVGFDDTAKTNTFGPYTAEDVNALLDKIRALGMAVTSTGGNAWRIEPGQGGVVVKASFDGSMATVTISEKDFYVTRPMVWKKLVPAMPPPRVSGDYLERCPPGWHWERHGSIDVCAPNVEGDDMLNGDDFDVDEYGGRDESEANAPGTAYDSLLIPVVGDDGSVRLVVGKSCFYGTDAQGQCLPQSKPTRTNPASKKPDDSAARADASRARAMRKTGTLEQQQARKDAADQAKQDKQDAADQAKQYDDGYGGRGPFYGQPDYSARELSSMLREAMYDTPGPYQGQVDPTGHGIAANPWGGYSTPTAYTKYHGAWSAYDAAQASERDDEDPGY